MKRRIILLIVLLFSVTVSAEAAGKLYLNSNTTYINEEQVYSDGAYATDTYTTTLLHFDGNLTDSGDGSTWTLGGNAATSTQNMFGSGSLSFGDATQDYLWSPDSDSWAFGDDDFTIDFWTYRKTGTNGDTYFMQLYPADRYINCYTSGSTSPIFEFAVDFEAEAPRVVLTDTAVMPNYKWTHTAIVRHDDTFMLFRDGIMVASQISTYTMPDMTGDRFLGSPYGNSLNGYMDEFRVSKGIARWTEDFTPPEHNLVCLMHFDQNAYEEVRGENWSVTGAVATTTAKFGSGSYYFDGSDYILSPAASGMWDFGGGDYTVELWVWVDPSSAGTFRPILTFNYGGVNDQYMVVENNLNSYQWRVQPITTADTSLPTGQWVHLAATRENDRIRMFQNGQLVGDVTATGDENWSTGQVMIGAGGGSYWFKGYIDELRIIQGKAVYTEAFTPPSTAPTTTIITPVEAPAKVYLSEYTVPQAVLYMK